MKKKFEELSAAGKRVAIARDVIAQLKMGQFEAQTGTYLMFRTSTRIREIVELDESDGRTVPVGKLLGKPCTACALGGMILGVINKTCDMAVPVQITGSYEADMQARAMRIELKNYFPEDQIRLIEHYFEGWMLHDFDEKTRFGVDTDHAHTFYWTKWDTAVDEENWEGARELHGRRMTLIMENIIKNRGTFRPDRL